MTPLELIGTIFIFFGCVLALTGSVGVLRMPNFYTRLHPAGKSDTLAQGLILLGLTLFGGQQLLDVLAHAAEHGEHGEHHGPPIWMGSVNVMFKLVLLALLLFLTAPTATHAIAKAARLDIHTPPTALGAPLADAPDPGESHISEIVVDGDAREFLEEGPKQVLDLDEPKPDPEPEPEPESDEPEPESDASEPEASEPDPDPADASTEDPT